MTRKKKLQTDSNIERIRRENRGDFCAFPACTENGMQNCDDAKGLQFFPSFLPYNGEKEDRRFHFNPTTIAL